jgi:hypothetical protein
MDNETNFFPVNNSVAAVRLRVRAPRAADLSIPVPEPKDWIGSTLHSLAPFAVFFPGRPFRHIHVTETPEEYAKERAFAYLSAHCKQFCACALILFILLIFSLTFVLSRGVEIVQPDDDFFRFSSAETRAARASIGDTRSLRLYRLGINATAYKVLTLSRATIIGTSDEHDTRAARKQAEQILAASNASCVCGAALLDRLNVVTIASKPVLHLYNVENLDAKLYELVSENDAPAELGALTVVRHSQAYLYDVPPTVPMPNSKRYPGTSDVDIVRQSEMRLVATDSDGHFQANILVSGAIAYCVAECIDLHGGKTIWHRALAQHERGIQLQDNPEALANLIAMFT